MGLIFKYYVFIGLGQRTKADIWVIKLQTPGREQLEGQERFFTMQMSQGLGLYLECSWTGAGAPEPNKAQGSLTLNFSVCQRIEFGLTTLCSKLSFPPQFVFVLWLTLLFYPYPASNPFRLDQDGSPAASHTHHQPAGIKPLLKCWILLKSLSTWPLVWIKPEL